MEAVGGQDFTTPESLRSFLELDVQAPGYGKAASLGPLSVPPSWPQANRQSPAPPEDTVGPVAAGRPRGRKFRAALMDMVRGRRAEGEEPKG